MRLRNRRLLTDGEGHGRQDYGYDSRDRDQSVFISSFFSTAANQSDAEFQRAPGPKIEEAVPR